MGGWEEMPPPGKGLGFQNGQEMKKLKIPSEKLLYYITLALPFPGLTRIRTPGHLILDTKLSTLSWVCFN